MTLHTQGREAPVTFLPKETRRPPARVPVLLQAAGCTWGGRCVCSGNHHSECGRCPLPLLPRQVGDPGASLEHPEQWLSSPDRGPGLQTRAALPNSLPTTKLSKLLERANILLFKMSLSPLPSGKELVQRHGRTLVELSLRPVLRMGRGGAALLAPGIRSISEVPTLSSSRERCVHTWSCDTWQAVGLPWPKL